MADSDDVDSPLYRRHTTQPPIIQKATMRHFPGLDIYAPVPDSGPGMAYKEPKEGHISYLEEINKNSAGEDETLPWYFRSVNSDETLPWYSKPVSGDSLSAHTMPYRKYNESQDDLYEFLPSFYKPSDLWMNGSEEMSEDDQEDKLREWRATSGVLPGLIRHFAFTLIKPIFSNLIKRGEKDTANR